MKRAITGLTFLALAGAAAAQDLEPRAYSPSPIGLNFAVLGFGRQTGAVVTDPTLPISDVNAHINGFSLGYGHTFGILGRQALVVALLPYAWGDVEGKVFEQSARITRSGLTDLKVKLSVNLYGSPALVPIEFMKERPNPLLIGVSFAFSAPSGQYFSDKLINLGTNRWAFKPEVGVSYTLWNNLSLDLYCGIAFFTANPDFYPGGLLRTEDPLTSLQFHTSYTFLPGLWLAFDSTWYSGGAATVNGGTPTARQDNTRIGGTVSVPVGRTQTVKLAYSAGASVRAGTDFKAISVAYQYRWF